MLPVQPGSQARPHRIGARAPVPGKPGRQAHSDAGHNHPKTISGYRGASRCGGRAKQDSTRFDAINRNPYRS
ncbi:hypothetical protein LRS73_14815 [Methylobacterium currus]|uniref:hypothetical protein n=1 Tax=Methylobacterium currus TaxID=2051553 RepID=UPI000F4F6F67|nr:hypothetical protein [Methylobacterium currus]UHC13865.1 hypothetical protein LRS73_14815 [Methylobacterium currus]